MNDEGNWNVSSWYAQIQSERRDMCCSWKRQSFPLLILMVSTPSSKHLDNGSSCDPMEHLLRKQYPTLEVDLSTTLTIWIIDQLELVMHCLQMACNDNFSRTEELTTHRKYRYLYDGLATCNVRYTAQCCSRLCFKKATVKQFRHTVRVTNMHVACVDPHRNCLISLLTYSLLPSNGPMCSGTEPIIAVPVARKFDCMQREKVSSVATLHDASSI